MKKILFVLAAYSGLISIIAIFSIYRSIGMRVTFTPQMFAINTLVLLPIIVFSICTILYIRRK